jgi:hypothetical protein
MVTSEDVIQVAEYLHIEINQQIIEEVLRRYSEYAIGDYIEDRFRAIEIILYGIIL